MENGNNHSQTNGNGRRDKNGLTEKQRRAIPVIAVAESVRQGVFECERLGIVSAYTYYHRWVHEPEFRQARDDAREKMLGEASLRVKSIFVGAAEEAASQLVKIAGKGQIGKAQVAGCYAVLQGAGIEEFQRKATNIQMQQTVVNEAEVRQARRARLKNHLTGITDRVFDRLGTESDQ